jgi:hypothetical protein
MTPELTAWEISKLLGARSDCRAMTPELTALALAGLLQMVQFVLFAVPANMELGVGYTSSPATARRRNPCRHAPPACNAP